MRRNTKIFISLITLLLVMNVGCFSFAYNKVMQKQNVSVLSKKSNVISTEKELEDFFVKNLTSLENKFSAIIDRTKISQYTITKIANKVVNYPEIASVYGGWSYTLKFTSKTRAKLTSTANYKISKENAKGVENYINKWIAINILPSMNDEEKIRAIHDYMVANYHYDYGESNKKLSGFWVYSPAALVYGRGGVCQAYVTLFDKFAKKAGITTQYISGEAFSFNSWGRHAWNMVKIDGKWYHIDVTWDDPLGNEEGKIYYNYYLKSDDYMSKNHRWKKDEYPKSIEDYEINGHNNQQNREIENENANDKNYNDENSD